MTAQDEPIRGWKLGEGFVAPELSSLARQRLRFETSPKLHSIWCKDASTTMIYTHVLSRGCGGVRSPQEQP